MHYQEGGALEQPIREDKYTSPLHPDVTIITRAYKDGSITVDLEGDNIEHISAVETELKVAFMRKGMIGKLRDRTEVVR
jgi:hypothetical protein